MSQAVLVTQSDSPPSAIAARGALYGWIAAATWIAVGIESIVRPEQHNYREMLWWMPFVFMTLTIIYVHLVQRGRGGRLETVSFWLVMIASGLVLLGNLGLVFEVVALASLGFPGGALVWTVGLTAFGIATWRTRVLPWYAGLSMILWEPGSIATGVALAVIAPLHERGSYTAGVWKGAAIAVVAYALQKLGTHHGDTETRRHEDTREIISRSSR